MNNELFAYAFLLGLLSEEGNPVYLSKIRTYVNKLVNELSKGRQIPIAQEDNISRDYIIFEQ